MKQVHSSLSLECIALRQTQSLTLELTHFVNAMLNLASEKNLRDTRHFLPLVHLLPL